MTIRERAIAYTGESEHIVDFDNQSHCCNCEGYDDYALAHAYYDGAKEEEEIQDANLMQRLIDQKSEFKHKLEEWCAYNLFNGTACVETPFETVDELLDNLFKHLEL